MASVEAVSGAKAEAAPQHSKGLGLIMRWFFQVGIEGFLAEFADRFNLVFQSQDDALEAKNLLRVFYDNFVELFTQTLLVRELNL